VERFVASYPARDERLVCAPGIILLKPELEVVGFGGVGYYLWDGNTADLLFLLRKEHWGKGLATELARAAIQEAFRHPEVETIHATAKPVNAASIRVLEKSGMRLLGYRPEVDRLVYRIDRPNTPVLAPTSGLSS